MLCKGMFPGGNSHRSAKTATGKAGGFSGEGLPVAAFASIDVSRGKSCRDAHEIAQTNITEGSGRANFPRAEGGVLDPVHPGKQNSGMVLALLSLARSICMYVRGMLHCARIAALPLLLAHWVPGDC